MLNYREDFIAFVKDWSYRNSQYNVILFDITDLLLPVKIYIPSADIKVFNNFNKEYYDYLNNRNLPSESDDTEHAIYAKYINPPLSYKTNSVVISNGVLVSVDSVQDWR